MNRLRVTTTAPRRALTSRSAGRAWLLALASLVLASCGAPAAAPASPPAPAGPSSAPPQEANAASQPAAPAAPAPLAPPVTVKLGVLMTLSDAGVFIAQERGYFAEEGLDVDLTRVNGAAEAMPHLTTGQLDAAGVTAAAAFFNAINRGLPLRIVGDKGRQTPEHSSGALALRPDVADSGRVRDWPDLRGLALGINVPNTGTVTDIQLDRMLERGGLTRDDVTIVELAYPDMNTAFATGVIDAGYQVEPYLALGESLGILRRWRALGEITPDEYTSVWLYGPAFAETEAAYRFMVANLRGVRDFDDAFLYGRDKAAVVDVLAEHTPVKDKTLYDRMGFNAMDPDGRVMPDRIAADVQYYLSKGFVQQPVDATKLIDPRFVDYAVARLGPYHPPSP
ncbi:MAG TPA: ABC transporter substrate-binding protein [Chloroflexota bacterium]|nr:ABC transporter substrate-binding protein [Chloroflexota bacterium]